MVQSGLHCMVLQRPKTDGESQRLGDCVCTGQGVGVDRQVGAQQREAQAGGSLVLGRLI